MLMYSPNGKSKFDQAAMQSHLSRVHPHQLLLNTHRQQVLQNLNDDAKQKRSAMRQQNARHEQELIESERKRIESRRQRFFKNLVQKQKQPEKPYVFLQQLNSGCQQERSRFLSAIVTKGLQKEQEKRRKQQQFQVYKMKQKQKYIRDLSSQLLTQRERKVREDKLHALQDQEYVRGLIANYQNDQKLRKDRLNKQRKQLRQFLIRQSEEKSQRSFSQAHTHFNASSPLLQLGETVQDEVKRQRNCIGKHLTQQISNTIQFIKDRSTSQNSKEYSQRKASQQAVPQVIHFEKQSVREHETLNAPSQSLSRVSQLSRGQLIERNLRMRARMMGWC